MTRTPRPDALLTYAALAVLYIVWGATFLGIRVAVRHVPPLTMASMRFLLAGIVLALFCLATGRWHRGDHSWQEAAWTGALMVLGTHGLVSWAQQEVEAGLAALVMATIPLWMIALEAGGRGGRPPSGRAIAATGTGLAGVAVLAGPGGAVDATHLGVMLLAAVLWAIGSVRTGRLGKTGAQWLAMQMLTGSGLLLLAAVITGEPTRLHAPTTPQTWWAAAGSILFLALAGSILTFLAYAWLLQRAPAAQVASYAYVNPLVAMALGWLLLGEAIPVRAWIAAPLVVLAVWLAIRDRHQAAPAPPTAGGARA